MLYQKKTNLGNYLSNLSVFMVLALYTTFSHKAFAFPQESTYSYRNFETFTSLPIELVKGDHLFNQKLKDKSTEDPANFEIDSLKYQKKPTIFIEKLDDLSIKKGYYIITNVFEAKKELKNGLEKLTSSSLDPGYFKNPKDKFYYVYIHYTKDLKEVKELYLSEFNDQYQNKMYILKVE